MTPKPILCGERISGARSGDTCYRVATYRVSAEDEARYPNIYNNPHRCTQHMKKRYSDGVIPESLRLQKKKPSPAEVRAIMGVPSAPSTAVEDAQDDAQADLLRTIANR